MHLLSSENVLPDVQNKIRAISLLHGLSISKAWVGNLFYKKSHILRSFNSKGCRISVKLKVEQG